MIPCYTDLSMHAPNLYCKMLRRMNKRIYPITVGYIDKINSVGGSNRNLHLCFCACERKMKSNKKKNSTR